MKKISLFITAACALWAFASCCQDRDPMYHRPTEGSMVLNVPAMQDQYIELTDGDLLELTTSQPDYGYSAVAIYTPQMSLTEDFKEFAPVEVVNNHLAALEMKQKSIAEGYCQLKGIEDPDMWSAAFPDGVPFETLYFRVACELQNVEGSMILSNVVAYNYVKPYFAVATPGYIYLIGACNDNGNWTEPSEGNADKLKNWRLYEPDNNIGSKIYTGIFEIPADQAMFRFYTELTGWDGGNSLGLIVDDNATDVEFVDGTYSGKLVNGKGSLNFPDWEGGPMTIVVNLSDENNMLVTISAGEVETFIPETIWIIGNYLGDWVEPAPANADKLWTLNTTKDAPTVYSGRFFISDEHLDLYFRFAYELNGWDGPNGNDPAQWGHQEADVSTDCTFNNGEYTGSYVVGKGAWHFVLPEPGYVGMEVDKDNQTVVFTYEAGAEE